MINVLLVAFVAIFVIEIRLRYLTIKVQPTEPEAYHEVDGDSPKFLALSAHSGNVIYLTFIKKVLETLGLKEVSLNSTSWMLNDWDLIWSFEFFDFIAIKFSNLRRHQRINHLPGNSFLASKSYMTTLTDSKYVPKAFSDAEELKTFAEKNPDTRFVQKLKSNRGVSLKTVSEMNFTKTDQYTTDFFAQVFIEDPMLLAGHKIDYAVYVAVTSVNPLRVYYYSKNVYIRICKLPYDANNFDDVDRYVVADNLIHGYEFPEIQKYFNKTFTYKTAFNMHLIEHGHDPSVIEEQIEDCIQSLVTSKEPKIIEAIKNLGAKYGKHHFFELFRFDFVIRS